MPDANNPRVLVLGGGIMGLCSAWALHRQGCAVTVVDQAALPNPVGASVDQHRLIRHAYGAERGYMRMVDDAYRAWDALFRAVGEAPYHATGTLALSDVAPSDAALPGATRPDGAAWGTSHPASDLPPSFQPETPGAALPATPAALGPQDGSGGTPADWLAASREALRDGGYPVEDLAPALLTERFPLLRAEGLAAALWVPSGGVLLADRIVGALARHLAASGVNFRTAAVREVDAERARLLLEDGAVLEADRLVLAAGPWTARLRPELRPRATPSRQVVVYLEPPEAHRAGWAAAPMLLDLSAAGGFYAVPPVAGTALKVGDHRFSCRGDAADDRAASPAEAEEILALARPRLRDAGRYRVLGARACYYDVAPDERIVLEPLGARGVVLCGSSGHGFKFGPVLGLAAALATLRPEEAAGIADWAAGTTPPPAALANSFRGLHEPG